MGRGERTGCDQPGTTGTSGERCHWHRSSSAGAAEGWSGRPCRRPRTNL